MTPRSWADALHASQTPIDWDGEILIERREIGRLRLPSGRIVAADAMVEPTLPAFDRAVEPGEYPVHLAIAHFRKGGDQRIAAAWLVFGSNAIARWVPTRLDATARRQPKPGEPAAYGVDSGTGSFLSPEAAASMTAQLSDEFAERVAEQMHATYVHTREWAMVELPGQLNLALFSSGLGDGAYASFWGLDADDKPVVLLTDFGLLDVPEELRPTKAAKAWWRFW
jgi:hypothetical protein